MDQNDNLIDLIAVLYKWRKRIIIFTLVAAIGTALISLLLPNYYKSTSIFYAASPDLAKPMSVGMGEKERNFYGQDTDLDRLFSIAKSNELADYLIDSFDLYKHYDIDSTKKAGPFNLRVKLAKLYQTQKNKYDALELSVEDEDPRFATNMARAATDMVNEIGQSLIKGSQKNLLSGYEANIEEKEKQLEVISKELVEQRTKYKIYSLSAQGESFASSMAKVRGKLQASKSKLNALKNTSVPQDSVILLSASVKGYQDQLAQLEKDIKLFNDGYTLVLSKELQQKDMVDQLGLDRERTKQLKSAYEAEFSSIHIVQEAETPIYKSRPKRSLIVIGIAFLAAILSCIWVLLMDRYKGQDWKKIIDK